MSKSRSLVCHRRSIGWLSFFERPDHKFPRPSLRAKDGRKPQLSDNRNGRMLMVWALALINQHCSTRYAQAIESGRILTEEQILKLVSLAPDHDLAKEYLAGACLAECYDGPALAAFAKNPRTGAEMLQLRHKQRIAAGGYHGEVRP